MAVTSGFFNSLYGDRKYNAEQFSAMFDNLITDGVFSNVGNAFQVTADGSNVLIDVGRAWFNSVWVYNDTLYPLPVQTSEVLLDRIDAVVIEINHMEAIRAGRIFFVQGTASADPERPVLTNTKDIHQYPLAYVYRKAGASTITQADITNMIGTSSCPYVTGILATQDIDKVVAQWEAQFNQWFEDLQIELSGDVAANLASQIIEIDARFEELARTGRVYEDLQDSANDTILDSDGNVIEGSTSFRQRSKDAPSGTGTSADVNNLKMDVTALTGRVEQVNTDLSNRINSVNSTLSPKVGDILVTARTNPGSNYLLCNGAVVTRSSYSSLSSLLPATPAGPWSEITSFELNNEGADVVYAAGYYVIAMVTSGYANYGLDIYYTQNPMGGWTKKTIVATADANERRFVKIRYVNGNFVILYFVDGGTNLYYATSPGGTWNLKRLHDTYEFRDIAYGNGRYVVSGGDGTSDEAPYVAHSTSLGGTWTPISAGGYTEGNLSSIIYAGGRFVTWGGNCLGYSTTGNSGWTFNTGYTDLISLVYANGKFVRITGGEYEEGQLSESSSITGPWTKTDSFIPYLKIYSVANVRGTYLANSLTYQNGFFILSYEKDVLYSRSIYGPWFSANVKCAASNIVYGNGDFVAVDTGGYAYATDKNKMIIPMIGDDSNVYTYIKAK